MDEDWDEIIYRNKLGNRIEADEMEILFRHKDYKIVGQDKVGNYFVSTVWLGVPHLGGAYFETMVTVLPKGGTDPRESGEFGKEIDIYRYHSLKEAEEGHEKVVKNLRRTNK